MSLTNENIVNKPSTFKGVSGKYYINEGYNSVVVSQQTGIIYRCKRASDAKKFWLKRYNIESEFNYARSVIPDSSVIGMVQSLDYSNQKSVNAGVFFILFEEANLPLTNFNIEEKDMGVVIADVLRGLKYLHETKNVAHGNITSDSILVGELFAAANIGRLTDFVDSPSIYQMEQMGEIEANIRRLSVEGGLSLEDRKKHDIFQFAKVLNNFYILRYGRDGRGTDSLGEFVKVKLNPRVEGFPRLVNYLALIAEMMVPHEDRENLDYFIKKILRINSNSP